MFLNHPAFAAIAAALAMAGMRSFRGPRNAQGASPGILGRTRRSRGPAKASPERRERRELVARLGCRQALKQMKADRRLLKQAEFERQYDIALSPAQGAL